MRKLKTAAAIFMAAITMCAATACGRGNGNNGDGPGADKTDDKVIEMWISTVNQPDYFYGWFEEAFEAANAGIDLEIEVSTNLGSNLDVTLAGKNSPDIVATSGGLVVPTLKAGNRILKVEDVLGPIKSTFHDTALLNQIDNEFWCAPIFGFASPVIYYNKTVFNQHGWTAPSSYAELVELCNNIKKVEKDGKQQYQTLVTGYTYHVLQAMTGKTMTEEQINAIIADKTDGAANPFDNDGMKNAYKWVEQMRKDKIFPENITGYSTEMASSNFKTQKALMVMSPGLDLLDLSSSTFELGSFTLPDAPAEFAQEGVNNGKVAGIYNDCLVISAKTEYPAECKKVIEFMYSAEGQQQLFNCFLYPVVKGTSTAAVDSAKKELFDSAFLPVYNAASENGMSIFWMNYFYKTGLDSACENTFKGVIGGSKTVDAAFNEMKNAW